MSLTLAVWGLDHPHAGGHLAALEHVPEVGRLLVWDRDPVRVERVVAESSRAEAVRDIERVVDGQGADAVVVLLPNRDAGPATLRAIRAGLYVYGDKPGALTAAEMQEIVAAAAETGAHFCPCYPWRTDPVTAEIKGLVDSGVLGDVWAFGANWITSQVAVRGPQNWLFHRDMAGGGILAWLAVHWFDLLAYLLGPAVEVAAMTATQCPEDIDVEDTASVILKLRSGAIGTVRAGYAHSNFAGYDEQDISITLEGSLGSVYWPTVKRAGYRLRTAHPGYAGISRRWVRLEYDPTPGAGGYSPEFLRAFCHCARERSIPPATEHDALYVLRVLEAVYASSSQRGHMQLD